MVEIIPKSKKSSPLLMKVFFSLSIGIFVLSVGGFVVLSLMESKTQSNIEEMEALLRAEKTQEQVQLEQDILIVQTRLKDFTELLLLKKDVLPVFSFLETVVHSQAIVASMGIDSNRHTVQLQGSAESFSALDEQLVIIEAREEPDSFSLTNLQLGQFGGVNFQMEIQFPVTFFQSL